MEHLASTIKQRLLFFWNLMNANLHRYFMRHKETGREKENHPPIPVAEHHHCKLPVPRCDKVADDVDGLSGTVGEQRWQHRQVPLRENPRLLKVSRFRRWEASHEVLRLTVPPLQLKLLSPAEPASATVTTLVNPGSTPTTRLFSLSANTARQVERSMQQPSTAQCPHDGGFAICNPQLGQHVQSGVRVPPPPLRRGLGHTEGAVAKSWGVILLRVA